MPRVSMERNRICVRAEFTIEEGKIEEFKKPVQEMSRLVEASEPVTIDYEFYLDRTGTKCVVHETYVNSEAALAHIVGVASQTILPKISGISKLSMLEVYGDPSEELRKVLTRVAAQTFDPFTGFSR